MGCFGGAGDRYVLSDDEALRVGPFNEPTAGVRDVATLQGEVDRLQATVESIETHCQHVIRCCGIPGYQAPFASAMAGEILGMIRSWER